MTGSRPNPLYDTRLHSANGLMWRGWVYEPVPELGLNKRLMIVEDHEDYLIVSSYSKHGGWHDKCQPAGIQYRSNRIGPGRPTKARIDQLKTAVKELQA